MIVPSDIAAEVEARVAWLPGDGDAPFAFDEGRAISRARFETDALAVAASLPAHGAMVDLCEDRYRFVVAFAAAAIRRHPVLMPGSRAPAVVSEILSCHDGAYRCDDASVAAALASAAPPASPIPRTLAAGAIAACGYTSGSTGQPQQHAKRWGALAQTTALNDRAVRAALSGRGRAATPQVLATVPPQHMYGLETSVMLPLLAGYGLHGARPLFPADVAAALAELPSPRVLVTTPVHLRAIVEAGVRMPEIGVVLSATAPLPPELARAAEAALHAPLLEMYGSTETCVVATRRTALEATWKLHDGVVLEPRPDGVVVRAPWLEAPVALLDLVELVPPHGFVLRGRNADLLEIAGKRASLAELTRRVLAVEGVRDAVVFQPDGEGPVRRVAALVVAPGLAPSTIVERLRASVDPAFLPRPLVVVESLPRNEVGKLPRERLVAALREPA